VVNVVSMHQDGLSLFSYDAVEDNEISFREADKIFEIDAVSEDWWQGRTLTGHVGFFPGACRPLGARVKWSLTVSRLCSEFRGSSRITNSWLISG